MRWRGALAHSARQRPPDDDPALYMLDVLRGDADARNSAELTGRRRGAARRGAGRRGSALTSSHRGWPMSTSTAACAATFSHSARSAPPVSRARARSTAAHAVSAAATDGADVGSSRRSSRSACSCTRRSSAVGHSSSTPAPVESNCAAVRALDPSLYVSMPLYPGVCTCASMVCPSVRMGACVRTACVRACRACVCASARSCVRACARVGNARGQRWAPTPRARPSTPSARAPVRRSTI